MNRDDLYRQVWSHPMTHVARELGKSDVAIAKLCRRLEVPVPPRGYWAKLKAGKEVTQTPLPAAAAGASEALPLPSRGKLPPRQKRQKPVLERTATIEIQLDVGTNLKLIIRRA